MSLLDCPAAERDRGLVLDLNFRDPTDITKARGIVTGALQYSLDRGARFDGSSYATLGAGVQPFSSGFWGCAVEFWPEFEANEAVYRYWFSAGSGLYVRHNNDGSIRVVINTVSMGDVALGAYQAYWKTNHKNVLVITHSSASACKLYLNGVLIGTLGFSASLYTFTSLFVGTAATGVNTYLGSISSVKFFRHNSAAELLTAQEAQDHWLNRNFNVAARMSVSLPMQAQQHEPSHATQITDVDQTAKITDGDMEAVNMAAWTTVGAGATFQKVAGARTGGSGTRVLQIIRSGASSYAYQNVLTSGVRYRATGWARGDGVASWPRVGTDAAMQWSGTTSATWQYFDVTFTSTSIWFVLYNQTNDGTVEFDDVTLVLAANQLSDGSMESSNTDPWSIGNNAALTKSLINPQAGLKSLQVAYGGTNSPYAYQTVLTVGKRYHADGYARGDTFYVPTVQDGAVVLWTGTTSTSWQRFSLDFTATTTGIRFQSSAVGAGYSEFDTCSVVQMLARTLDASGRGNNLILGDGSTVTTQPTKLSVHGYSLDGGDYFKRETAIGIPTDFTVVMLVKPSSSTGTRALWSCRNSAAGKSIAVYGTAAAETLTILHNVGASTILTTVPLPLGAASHYGFVYTNATRVMQIYYNGALAYTSAALTDTNGHDNGFWVGALPTPEYYWLGSVLSADVMAFAATPLQVKDHYRQSIGQIGQV